MRLRASNWVAVTGLACAYVLAAKLGLISAAGHLSAFPVWPATGMVIAALLLFGCRLWPGVLLGAFVASLSSASLPAAFSGRALVASVGMAIGSTLEGLLGAWLTQRYAGGRKAFDHPHTVFRFVALTAVFSTALGPTLGLSALSALGFEPWHTFWSDWFTWWLGNMASTLVVTPVFLVWVDQPMPRPTPARIFEMGILLITLLLVGELAMGRWKILGFPSDSMTFLVIPLVLWAALRFGPQATSATVLLLAFVAIAGTLRSAGPFASPNLNKTLLMLQAFIGVVAVTGLVLAADAGQRRRAESELRVSEQRHRDLFESNPQAAWVYDRETLQILAANRAALQQYGYSREEFLKLCMTDLHYPGDSPRPPCDIQLRSQGNQEHHRTKAGALLEVETWRRDLQFGQRPVIMVLAADVTERNRATRRATAFSDLGERLGAARTPGEVARIVAETADALFHWDAFALHLCSSERASLQNVLTIDTMEGSRQEFAPDSAELGALIPTLRQSGPQMLLRPAGSPFPSWSKPTGHAGRPSALLMCAPITKGATTVGILSLQSYTLQIYTKEDLEVLQALADHCSGTLERIRAEEEVERLNRELRRHLEELQVVITAAPVGIAVAQDPDCRVVTGNAACAAIMGLDFARNPRRNGDLPRHPTTIIRRGGREVPPEELPMRLAARRGAPVTGEELEITFQDGRVIHCYASASPLYDDVGQVRGSLGVFVDLTERKRAEREILRLNTELEHRVRERTRQLEAANQELEAFSYSVSHDLRAPLRSVRGFCEVLAERYTGSLDARGQDFLRRACSSCQQMDRLVEDLLKLSRLGRSEMQWRTVNLSALAESIASELNKSEPQRTVQWVIAPGLQSRGDERLLRVALDNLLRNAWKFTRHQPSARIEFGALAGQGGAFFVKDNGAGFDMAYASRLFAPFQRLHSAAEFPGTGIGLATVQRIIHRHGGRLWATGAVNEGATFSFALPPESSA